MTTVALVTDPDSTPIDYDMALLLDACRETGVQAEVCSWQDDTVDWGRFGVVVLRSPWTYVEHLPEFLAWCARVDAVTELLNPLSAVTWSLDKHYLGDLATLGVPVVATTFVTPEADPATAVHDFLAEHRDSPEMVIKPTVGAYSKGVQRFARTVADDAVKYVSSLQVNGSHVMLQPYYEAIDRHGETDMILFDGVYSHAIRKEPLLMADGTVNEPTFESRSPRDAGQDERAVAATALAATASHLGLKDPLLYARVDLIRDDADNPIVLELEICEPSLSLPFTDGGALRFAQAIANRL